MLDLYKLLLHLALVYPCQLIAKGFQGSQGVKYSILVLALITFGVDKQVYLGNKEPNYFKLLEVGRASTTADIKRAFKKQSLVYHPDKNSSPDAQEYFTRIQAAYEVLSDPLAKEHYDKFGEIPDQKKREDSGIYFRVAAFYVVWLFSSFIFLMGDDCSNARQWSFAGLVVIGILEFQMLFYDLDLFGFIFPSTTLKEQIEIMHSLFPLFMHACRLVSQYVYVDIEAQTQDALVAISRSNADILRALNDLQCSLDKKGGKKVGTTEALQGGAASVAAVAAAAGNPAATKAPQEEASINARHRDQQMQHARRQEKGEAKKRGGISLGMILSFAITSVYVLSFISDFFK